MIVESVPFSKSPDQHTQPLLQESLRNDYLFYAGHIANLNKLGALSLRKKRKITICSHLIIQKSQCLHKSSPVKEG